MCNPLIAFLIAPLWVPTAVVAFLFVIWLIEPTGNLSLFVWVWIVTGLITYAGTMLFGVPAWMVLHRWQVTSWCWAPPVGFVCGDLTWAAFVASTNGNRVIEALSGMFASWGAILFTLLVPGGLGIIVGITWWLLVRPDRAAT